MLSFKDSIVSFRTKINGAIILYFAAILASLTIFGCAKPIANFTTSQEKWTAPAKVKFNNLSQKAETFQWSFGDGGSSTLAAPEHKYVRSGDYKVQLLANKGKKSSTKTMDITVKAPAECIVELETEFGTMEILLNDATPKHRDNFIKLVEEGFFNDLLFHRVIDGFMIQGGDPQSRNASTDQPLGMGGPGYTIPAEFVDSLVHFKGALAAARQGDAVNPEKASSGSQFYIVQGRPVTNEMLNNLENQKNKRYTQDQREKYAQLGGTPFLDREYTVFGKVIKGLDIIDKIAKSPLGKNDRPIKDVKMKMRLIH